MSKSLKVVSVSADGWEHEVIHALPSSMDDSSGIVVTLQGVLRTRAAIKSFEIVQE